jgi:hypothetical protein
MGLAAQFSKHLHKEVGAHAAWLPVANSFELGDYGLVSDGVFNRMGNVREFGVQVTGDETDSVKLDFKSEGTRLMSLVGEAEVNALPDSPIEAALKIEFSDKDSYYAKAARASVQEIPNLRQVAEQLAKADGWRRKFRVVRATITGHDCVIVTSKAAKASFVLKGNADALKQLSAGAVGAGVEVASEKDVGLSIVGDSGVVGLRLFKLKWWGGDQAKLLGPNGEVEVEDDDGDELEDDV